MGLVGLIMASPFIIILLCCLYVFFYSKWLLRIANKEIAKMEKQAVKALDRKGQSVECPANGYCKDCHS